MKLSYVEPAMVNDDQHGLIEEELLQEANVNVNTMNVTFYG